MRAFLLIIMAGLVCAALGGGFGWLIDSLSPEFLTLVAQPYGVAEPQRLGAVLGLVSGLLLGAAIMAFCLVVEAFRLWAIRGKENREVPPNRTPHHRRDTEEDSSSFHVRPA